jgi:hypothetical protein
MRKIIATIVLCVVAPFVIAQEDLAEHVIGVWHMDPRTLESPGITAVQEEGTVSVLERSPDGTFRVLARITTRATAISDDLFFIPGCVGKTECVYDDATEGIGRLMNDKFFIDWLDDDGWIDDLLTIDGNEMTGDDGNGPIRLVKEE